MFLVHVSEDKIPKNKGLKSGPVGLEKTVVLVKEPTEKDILYRKLNTLSSISLFEDLKMRNVRNLIQVAKEGMYEPKEIIVEEGQIGHTFFIILGGIVKVKMTG